MEVDHCHAGRARFKRNFPASSAAPEILLALGKTDEANAAFAKARERKPGLNLTLQDTLKRLAP